MPENSDALRIDNDVDAARILLHRATIVVRSTELLPEAGDAAPTLAAGTHAARVSDHRSAHRALVTHHLGVLRKQFVDLAGCDPPQEFSHRGGTPPEPLDERSIPSRAPELMSAIRRTEWAAAGLDAVIASYADRAAYSARLVRATCDALRRWVSQARADA